MKLFIVDSGKIRIFPLPRKIEEDYSFLYTPIGYSENYLITLSINNNVWYLSSNGEVNVEVSNIMQGSVPLDDYGKCYLKIGGIEKKFLVYFIPDSNEKVFRLDLNTLDKVTVGSDPYCNIFYNINTVAKNHAVIYLDKQDNTHYLDICEDVENYSVYLNYYKITYGKVKLKVGDVIFIEGLKIIYMNEFIEINNPNNYVQVQGLVSYSKLQNLSNNDYQTDINAGRYIDLYKDNDYFYHIPKIREEVVEEEIIIDSPPANQKSDEIPFILTIGSSITMGASTLMMGWNVGYGLISKTRGIIQLIPQIVMCIAMIFGSLILPRLASRYQKKKRKKYEKMRQEKYIAYLEKKELVISSIIKNQELILRTNNLSVNECANIIISKNKNFWSNEITDSFFLKIRLGLGSCDAMIKIKAPEEHFSLEVDNLLQNVYDMINKYKKLSEVPVTLSLLENNITSFVFDNKLKYEYIEGILIQLMALHSPNDLKIVVITDETSNDRWNYVKILSHCQAMDKSQRFFSTTLEEANEISNYLMNILNARKEKINGSGGNKEVKMDVNNKYINFSTYYLIITDNYRVAKKLKIINEIIENENDNYGFSLVAIDNSMKNLPTNSKVFVNVGQKDGIIYSKNINTKNQLTFVNEYNLDNDIYALSAIVSNVPTETKSGASVLPQSLTFLDMYGVSKIEQLNILNRWKNNNPVTNLNAIIGVHTSGEAFKLNLHEKFHGPHGLIAGSTGSGKSEFIITYILSMAVNYHPYEVQFVLIDYKGGGLAGAFENKETGIKLPHLAGTITNLDTSEMNRTLVSIQSELKRRQKVFNEVRDRIGVSTIDIYKYQQLYREGVVKQPMSHLFIISDEFAELKSQQPEFMSQLISTARIGRSLGVHLILATQKPSGVVNDQIWSNSKFKVCLKVQDKSDSMEMLKRPEAASIKEAGRFYLQVGYDDYFDIGQSGWSGAKYVPSDKIMKKVDDSINFIDNVGNVIKTINNEVELASKETDYGDQLTNLVQYIYNLGLKENIVSNKLWLDSIPATINLNSLKQKYSYKPTPYLITPVIGEYDNPVNQEQGLLNLDLTKNGNTVIYGQTGSGKENLLMTIIWSTIVEHTPDEVNIYILDYGAEILNMYRRMPHVGDVLTIDQNDKVYDMMQMLSDEIDRRKDLFANYGGNYIDYINNNNNKLPLIVTIINNYEIFCENNAKLSENIQPLYRDGSKYGIIFIITAISTNAIRSRMLQNFNNKICLQIPNEMEYRTILRAPKGLVPSKIFGRGLFGMNDTAYEFQTAYFIEKNQLIPYINEVSIKLSQAYTSRAKKIPTIPDFVTINTLDAAFSIEKVAIGYNIDTKQQFYFNFDKNKITQIITQLMDDDKMDFIYGIANQLSKIAKVTVIDFVEAFERRYENIALYNSDFNSALINIINEILTISSVKKVYMILGIGVLNEKIDNALYNKLSNILDSIGNISNTNFVFIDTYNSYKKIQIENWYQDSVDNTSGIWLGKDIGSQILINVSNLSLEDRKLNFPCMAFVVDKGNKVVIKHLIDRGSSSEK